MSTHTPYGPLAVRVRWVPDDEPIECGDIPEAEMYAYAERYGVYGVIVETRAPACPCCGHVAWIEAASLWSIIGDDAYHREIEREMIREATS